MPAAAKDLAVKAQTASDLCEPADTERVSSSLPQLQDYSAWEAWVNAAEEHLWNEGIADVEPLVSDALDTRYGNFRKIRSVLALAKQQAVERHFSGALRTLGWLLELVAPSAR